MAVSKKSERDGNGKDCKDKHSPLWRLISVSISLSFFALLAVGNNYLQIARVQKQTFEAAEKADTALGEVRDATQKAISDIRVNAATAAADSKAIKERLQELAEQQKQIAERSDKILQALLELQKSQGGP
jgi:hypothetical protein